VTSVLSTLHAPAAPVKGLYGQILSWSTDQLSEISKCRIW